MESAAFFLVLKVNPGGKKRPKPFCLEGEPQEETCSLGIPLRKRTPGAIHSPGDPSADGPGGGAAIGAAEALLRAKERGAAFFLVGFSKPNVRCLFRFRN